MSLDEDGVALALAVFDSPEIKAVFGVQSRRTPMPMETFFSTYASKSLQLHMGDPSLKLAWKEWWDECAQNNRLDGSESRAEHGCLDTMKTMKPSQLWKLTRLRFELIYTAKDTKDVEGEREIRLLFCLIFFHHQTKSLDFHIPEFTRMLEDLREGLSRIEFQKITEGEVIEQASEDFIYMCNVWWCHSKMTEVFEGSFGSFKRYALNIANRLSSATWRIDPAVATSATSRNNLRSLIGRALFHHITETKFTHKSSGKRPRSISITSSVDSPPCSHRRTQEPESCASSTTITTTLNV